MRDIIIEEKFLQFVLNCEEDSRGSREISVNSVNHDGRYVQERKKLTLLGKSWNSFFLSLLKISGFFYTEYNFSNPGILWRILQEKKKKK